jgi:hypothetical protein
MTAPACRTARAYPAPPVRPPIGSAKVLREIAIEPIARGLRGTQCSAIVMQAFVMP